MPCKKGVKNTHQSHSHAGCDKERSKKVQVYKVVPKLLLESIDELGLSKIMRNKAIKLVCLLIQKGMQNNHDLAAYAPLPTKYLEKVFTPFYHTDFFNLLKSKRIVECNEVYKQGSITSPGHSKGYRISQELLDGEFVSASYSEIMERKGGRDFIGIKRTYFYSGDPLIDHVDLSFVSFPLHGTCYELPITGSHVVPDTLPGSVSHTSLSTTTSHTSLPAVMHISTKLFQKSLLIDDLSSLFYDEERIWKKTEELVANISTKLFKTGTEVANDYFEVTNHLTGTTYYTTKTKALLWSKDKGITLIQDGKYFYIDDLERYVTLKKRNQLLNYMWYMKKLQKKIFYGERNTTNNRLDHNLTSLNKHTMQIIKEDNNLIEIDMKNAQFAIHAYWMKQEGLCQRHRDVRLYYEMCSKGILYDELSKLLNVERGIAKQMMMELAFSSHKYNTTTKKLFKERFPNVIAHIDGFKKEKKHSSLFSVELQLLESEIFVDNLYPNIKELDLFCLTKHDSIIIRKEDEARVIKLMKAYFNDLGLECALEVDKKTVLIAYEHEMVPAETEGIGRTENEQKDNPELQYGPLTGPVAKEPTYVSTEEERQYIEGLTQRLKKRVEECI